MTTNHKLTDKDGDLAGRGGHLDGRLDRRRGLGVEGDGLREIVREKKKKKTEEVRGESPRNALASREEAISISLSIKFPPFKTHHKKRSP